MRISLVVSAVTLMSWWGAPPAVAACQTGDPSAPFIGRHDLAAMEHASAKLPRAARVRLSVGNVVPSTLATAPLPPQIVKVLPQYAGYRGFRQGRDLVIVDASSRVITYMMPLGLAPGRNCPG